MRMEQFRIDRSLLFLISLTLVSCSNKPKTIYFDTDFTSVPVVEDEVSETSYSFLDTDEIIVPYREESGVKIIAVKVNGMRLDMIFDTGCSGTLISMAEANYLYQKGLLVYEDILGTTQSMIADGSIVENAVVNLKEVIIADKIICSNVQATVSNNMSAPLLLGNEVFNRAASYTIDNINKTIIFKLK